MLRFYRNQVYICNNDAINIMKKLFTFILSLVVINTSAQLEGKVIDASTQNPIPFANLYFVDLNTGVSADMDGMFSIDHNLPSPLNIKVSAIGYRFKLLKVVDVSQNLTIDLSPSHVDLKDVEIIERNNEIKDRVIANIETAEISDIDLVEKENLGNIISTLPGVYNASIGNGIYKPVIRGLSGIRVASFLNGQKLENQQWGGDHGLGVASTGIEKVEVIKGPATLLYGSDALGGVLYLKEESFADHDSYDIQLKTRFSENTLGINNELKARVSLDNFRVNAYYLNQNHGDYRLPDGQFARLSRYKGQLFKTIVGYNKKNWISTLGYSYSDGRVGLPGHTHDSIITVNTFLSNNRSRTEATPSQVLNNHLIRWTNTLLKNNNEYKLVLGQQINRLQEFEKFTIPAIDMRLNSSTYYGTWKHQFNNTTYLLTGVQGMYQTNANGSEAEEQIIPNATTLDNGLFTMLHKDVNELAFQIGVRGDVRLLETDSINRSFNSINYSFGVSYKLNDIELKLNATSGFRAPHSSELLANGIHHGANRFELGDPTLISEYGNQIDFSLGLNKEHFNLIFNPYINLINNYIYLQPSDSVIDNNTVYRFEQTNQAILYGGEVSLHYHPHFLHQIHYESNISYVYGEQLSGEPIAFIPQPRWLNQLSYNFDKTDKKVHFKNISIQYEYYLSQNRVVPFELTSGDYHLVNMSANMGYKTTKGDFILGVGVNNLLNTTYIDHLSNLKPLGILNQGTAFYASLSYRFKALIKH